MNLERFDKVTVALVIMTTLGFVLLWWFVYNATR